MFDDLRLAPLAEEATIEPPLLSPLLFFPSTWNDQLPSLSDSLWPNTTPRCHDRFGPETTRTLAPLARLQPQDQQQEPTGINVGQLIHHDLDKSPENVTTKNVAPLADVLNQDSDIHKHEITPSRKRRRLDDSDRRYVVELPKPNVVQPEQHTWIPPLLQGLHEPPPDAGIFPPITDTRFCLSGDQYTIPTPTKASFVESIEHCSPAEQRQILLRVGTPAPKEKSPPPVPPPESPLPPQPQADTLRKPKRRTQRKPHRTRWTSAETACLLKGVAKFGIGQWKKILTHPAYTFHGRTAVDLKDRFRTCRPSDYKSPVGTQPSQSDEPIPEVSKRPKPSKKKETTPHLDETSLLDLDIATPLPKSTRRARRPFTTDEDCNLLLGFDRHGTSWKAMAEDAELHLDHRRPKDLRDRMRVRFPGMLGADNKEVAMGRRSILVGNLVESQDGTVMGKKDRGSALKNVGAMARAREMHDSACEGPGLGQPRAVSAVGPGITVNPAQSASRAHSAHPQPIKLDRSILKWANAGHDSVLTGEPAETDARYVDPLVTWRAPVSS
ncbi:MAG: hypothetical protein M1828_006333 [Chrysothrix sp. TS-e1954]|nr:MAG: hypothetical protein M1828_006333 [Chrysothrix sp. TS-e1954]